MSCIRICFTSFTIFLEKNVSNHYVKRHVLLYKPNGAYKQFYCPQKTYVYAVWIVIITEIYSSHIAISLGFQLRNLFVEQMIKINVSRVVGQRFDSLLI